MYFLFYYLFIYFFVYLFISVYEVYESRGTKEDKKKTRKSFYFGEYFLYFAGPYVISGNKKVKVLLCVG